LPFHRHAYATDFSNEVDQYVVADSLWTVSAAGGTFMTGQQFTAGKSGWLAEIKFKMSLASSCNETLTVSNSWAAAVVVVMVVVSSFREPILTLPLRLLPGASKRRLQHSSLHWSHGSLHLVL